MNPSAIERDCISALLSDLKARKDLATVVLSTDDQVDYILDPEEEKTLSPKAVRKRQLEFRQGRAAAKLSLKQLGFNSPPPITQGHQREPIWPVGIVGSITHSGQWTVVVAGWDSHISAIGIDLESSRRMATNEIVSEIAKPEEEAWIRHSSDPNTAATMLFSSKEATFKAYNPHCKQYFDFRDVELIWVPARETFQGKLLVSLEPWYVKGHQFEVSCRSNNNWVLAYLVESTLPVDAQLVDG